MEDYGLIQFKYNIEITIMKGFTARSSDSNRNDTTWWHRNFLMFKRTVVGKR